MRVVFLYAFQDAQERARFAAMRGYHSVHKELLFGWLHAVFLKIMY